MSKSILKAEWANLTKQEKEDIPITADDWHIDCDIIGHYYQEKLLKALIEEAGTHGFIINGQTVNGLVPSRFLKIMLFQLDKLK